MFVLRLSMTVSCISHIYIRALYVGQWTQRVTIARVKVIPVRVSGHRYFNRYPLIIVEISFRFNANFFKDILLLLE